MFDGLMVTIVGAREIIFVFWYCYSLIGSGVVTLSARLSSVLLCDIIGCDIIPVLPATLYCLRHYVGCDIILPVGKGSMEKGRHGVSSQGSLPSLQTLQ